MDGVFRGAAGVFGGSAPGDVVWVSGVAEQGSPEPPVKDLPEPLLDDEGSTVSG
jgi:hypothetical protein